MIYFFLYLFLETVISVNIASELGGFWTFVELVVSAMVGLLLLTNFRYTFFENMQALRRGAISPETFQSQNMAAVIGAILLIVPGFLTDINGVLLQFGLFANMLANRFAAWQNRHTPQQGPGIYQEPFNEGECDVIDVEVVDPADRHR
jgi:2-isopropylmalate synthase/UPF0716 protein FxsA